MRNWIIKKRDKLIKAIGGYTKDEYSVLSMTCDLFYYDSERDSLAKRIYKNFFLDTIQGKNRDEHGKFTSRDSLKEYFAWCHTYGQMPHKKLTNAFMRYESTIGKVKSVKRTGEA